MDERIPITEAARLLRQRLGISNLVAHIETGCTLVTMDAIQIICNFPPEPGEIPHEFQGYPVYFRVAGPLQRTAATLEGTPGDGLSELRKEIFGEGVEARRANVPTESCPYTNVTVRSWWFAGYQKESNG